MKLVRSSLDTLLKLKVDRALRQSLESRDGNELRHQIQQLLATAEQTEYWHSTQPALEAALCATFVASELSGEVETVDQVLLYAGLETVDGMARLKLGEEDRATVLTIAAQEGRLTTALALTAEADAQLLTQQTAETMALESAWLRQFLRGRTQELHRYALPHLIAANRARNALSAFDMPANTPSVDKVRGVLEYRELLEPMRLMIGAPWPRPGIILEKDLFAGRVSEVKRLRVFVDELESQSAMESWNRVFTRTGRFFSDKARLLMISARGGLGKSTLISKFVYDHASRAEGLPFAYLDFDSAALHPQNHLLLLVEVARQVALFHPDYTERLMEFSHSVRQSLLDVTSPSIIGNESTADENMGQGFAFYRQFRELMQQLIYNSRAKSFLLVLDTLELVQSDPMALEGLLQFLQGLTRDGFPQLAIVASGRSEVIELGELVDDWTASSLVLEPLHNEDAIQMVQLLGERLLKDQWMSQWAKKIVGKSNANAPREPLSLRICVEAIRNEKPELRESLVNQIAELGETCDSTRVDFVGRLYQKRILEHIADPDARRLAWPGLVARSISLAMVREVLAPECGLSDEQAIRAFERLSREVWIVTKEGEYLRHRPDLRARTLPLMRRHDEVMFKRICEMMSNYYLNQHPRDANAQAEAHYYNLLADNGNVTALLDNENSGALRKLLTQRVDDFGEDSLVAQELAVRQASKLLPVQAFCKLPMPLAWRHFEQTGSALRNPVDLRLDTRVTYLSSSLNWKTFGVLTAAEQTILIKTGRWSDLLNCRFARPANHQDVDAVLFLANFISSMRNFECRWSHEAIGFIKYNHPSQLSWKNLAYSLLPLYRTSPDRYHRFDWELARAISRNGVLQFDSMPALRLAIAFGTQSSKAAVEILIKYGYELDAFGFQFSKAEMMALDGRFPLAPKPAYGVSEQITNFFQSTPDKHEVSRKVLDMLKNALFNQQFDWSDRVSTRHRLRRFALAGSADLASPVGYLIAASNMSLHAKTWPRFSGEKKSKDIMHLCRNAEENGALPRLLFEAMQSGGYDKYNGYGAFADNFKLLHTIGAHWVSGLAEDFKPDELPGRF